MANQISFLGSLFISIYIMYAYAHQYSTFVILFYPFKDDISQNVSSLDSFYLWPSAGDDFALQETSAPLWRHIWWYRQTGVCVPSK